MTNWIICLTQNNLDLTKQAVRSFLAQDIGDIRLFIFDNGSTDGTGAWLRAALEPEQVVVSYGSKHRSVAQCWNKGLRMLFKTTDRVLVCNNDVVLNPATYSSLVFLSTATLGPDYPLATAVGVSDVSQFLLPTMDKPPRPHPDFSCFLVWKHFYEEVGEFDEAFTPAFCEDNDYHCRIKKHGLEAYCFDIPFYHVGSATVKTASPEDQQRIQKAADANRAYFKQKWGFEVGSPEYEEFFKS